MSEFRAPDEAPAAVAVAEDVDCVRIWLPLDAEDLHAAVDWALLAPFLRPGGVVATVSRVDAVAPSPLVRCVTGESDIAMLLAAGGDVFVPGALVEAILAHEAAPTPTARLWLEDGYITRHALPRLSALADGRVVLVGRHPRGLAAFDARRYVFRCAASMDMAGLADAFLAGVREIWVDADEQPLQRRLRRVRDVIDAAHLSALFAGQAASDLARTWEQRQSLAAARPLEAGCRIGVGDLTTVPGAAGLSVDQRHHIVGRRLRYAVAGQTPLTFGMIEC